MSATDFFADCPWGQIPEHRRADISIEPLYHSRGLLGGASKDGKMSKLAALAAKRRQKENANPTTPTKADGKDLPDEYTASLSKLTLSNEKMRDRKRKPVDKEGDALVTEDAAREGNADSELGVIDSTRNLEDEPIVERTKPSAFAGTFLTTKATSQNPSFDSSIIHGLPGVFDFKDPSPDDIVYKAQTGRTR